MLRVVVVFAVRVAVGCCCYVACVAALVMRCCYRCVLLSLFVDVCC